MSSPYDGDEVFLRPALPREERGAPPFAQGVVEAWNAVPGTNRIRVRGQSLDNLLSLVGSEGGLIRAGDVVAVIYYQDTAAVLGRIDAPGVEQRALGITTATVAGGVSTTADVFEDLGGPTVTVHIGSSRRCSVQVSALTAGFDCIGFAGFTVTGASTIAATERRSFAAGWGAATSGTVWVNGTRTVNLTAADGLNEGVNTFRMVYKTSAGVSGNAQFSDREITVQPF
jgi:hypothetical protein